MQSFHCQVWKTKIHSRSVDADINHIETAFIHWQTVCNESYTHYGQPTMCLWISSFASRSIVANQFLPNLYPRYLSEKRCDPSAFLRLRPAIHGMYIISLVFGKYSSTSAPYLIQLLLLNFYDVLYAISIISTMCTRSVWRVMQLNAWVNAE